MNVCVCEFGFLFPSLWLVRIGFSSIIAAAVLFQFSQWEWSGEDWTQVWVWVWTWEHLVRTVVVGKIAAFPLFFHEAKPGSTTLLVLVGESTQKEWEWEQSCSSRYEVNVAGRLPLEAGAEELVGEGERRLLWWLENRVSIGNCCTALLSWELSCNLLVG